MKMKIGELVIVFLLCTISTAAQPKVILIDMDVDTISLKYKWMGYFSKHLTSIDVDYKKPVGFKELGTYECFEETPKLDEAFSCVFSLIQADDNQFKVFLSPIPKYSKERILDMRKLVPDFDPDKIPVNRMKNLIKVFYGKEKANNWQQFVTFYSSKEAHKKFNADSAMRLSISLSPQDAYQNVFKNIEVLIFQKKACGANCLICFYTDIALNHFDSYWKKIEKVCVYGD